MAFTLKQQVADLTLVIEHLDEMLTTSAISNLELQQKLQVAESAASASGDTRIGKRRGGVCPVSGKPTVGRRVFAGPGRDAMAKRAINLLLAGLEDEAERYMVKEENFADPDRIRAAAKAIAAKGIEEIEAPSDWLRQ